MLKPNVTIRVDTVKKVSININRSKTCTFFSFFHQSHVLPVDIFSTPKIYRRSGVTDHILML